MARPTPAHRKISDEIRRRIVAKEYEHEELPSEVALIEEFGVSRPTIRMALQHLVNDGLIVRQPGSGTRILSEGRGGYWAIGSLDDLTGEFKASQGIILSAGVEPARNYPHVLPLFGLRPNSKIFHILRLLAQNGLVYASSHLFAYPALTANIPPQELGRAFFIDLVQRYSGEIAARARQEVFAEEADKEVARQIDVKQGSPVLVVKRTYFTSNDKPLVHAEIVCRTDRYSQVVNFIRGGSIRPHRDPSPVDGE